MGRILRAAFEALQHVSKERTLRKVKQIKYYVKDASSLDKLDFTRRLGRHCRRSESKNPLL